MTDSLYETAAAKKHSTFVESKIFEFFKSTQNNFELENLPLGWQRHHPPIAASLRRDRLYSRITFVGQLNANLIELV